MPVTDYADLPYPNGDQDAVVAADLMALAEGVDQTVPLIAADAADRDARFSDVKGGRIVSTPDGTQWVKTSTPPEAPSWMRVFSDTGVLTSGLVQANPSEDVEIDRQWGRIRAGHVSLYINIIWTGADWSHPANGDIANKKVATVLGKFVPPYTVIGSYATPGFNGGCYLSAQDGGLWLKDSKPNAVIANGSSISFQLEYAEDA